MLRTNETRFMEWHEKCKCKSRFMEWHEKCKCKCRLNAIVCNN